MNDTYNDILTECHEAFRKTLEYSALTDNGNRSSKRTDILNDAVAKVVQSRLPDSDNWELSTEQKIQCARATSENRGKTFSIDLVFTHKITKRNIYILLKAVESSYNKNSNNFANTTIGETARIHGHSEQFGSKLKDARKNDITLFLTLMPKRVPMGKKSEVVKYTTPHISDLRLFNKNIHQICVILDNEEEHGVRCKKSLLESLSGHILNGHQVRKDFGGFLDNVREILQA